MLGQDRSPPAFPVVTRAPTAGSGWQGTSDVGGHAAGTPSRSFGQRHAPFSRGPVVDAEAASAEDLRGSQHTGEVSSPTQRLWF